MAVHWDIRRYARLSSTNDELKQLALSGASEGAVVVSDGQTAGRGREGHQWFSPEGKGLYVSCLLRPSTAKSPLPTLTLMAGLAVCDAVERFVTIPPQLKWPNDIWLAGRKVGGILTELIAGAVTPLEEAVIIGIGMNINLRQDELPTELQQSATSLAVVRGQPLDREIVLQDTLTALAARYQAWCEKGWSTQRNDYDARHALPGVRVRVAFGAEPLEGIVRGVDDAGALLLETAAGHIEPVIAGDVSLCS